MPGVGELEVPLGAFLEHQVGLLAIAQHLEPDQGRAVLVHFGHGETGRRPVGQADVVGADQHVAAAHTGLHRRRTGHHALDIGQVVILVVEVFLVNRGQGDDRHGEFVAQPAHQVDDPLPDLVAVEKWFGREVFAVSR